MKSSKAPVSLLFICLIDEPLPPPLRILLQSPSEFTRFGLGYPSSRRRQLLKWVSGLTVLLLWISRSRMRWFECVLGMPPGKHIQLEGFPLGRPRTHWGITYPIWPRGPPAGAEEARDPTLSTQTYSQNQWLLLNHFLKPIFIEQLLSDLVLLCRTLVPLI